MLITICILININICLRQLRKLRPFFINYSFIIKLATNRKCGMLWLFYYLAEFLNFLKNGVIRRGRFNYLLRGRVNFFHILNNISPETLFSNFLWLGFQLDNFIILPRPTKSARCFILCHVWFFIYPISAISASTQLWFLSVKSVQAKFYSLNATEKLALLILHAFL